MKLFALSLFLLTGSFPAHASECGGPAAYTTPGLPTSKPKVIILSAPSGGGKTTLAQMLIKDFKNAAMSVSTTTRAPRGQEKNGVDYHFLTVEEFKARIAAGKFAEYAEVHGNFYGTDMTNIQNEFAQGHSVLALVDIKGAENLKKAFPDDTYTIFINPPDMVTLEKRLRGRGTDKEEAIQLRLANAKKEMAEADKFDSVIVNGDLQQAYDDLVDLIKGKSLIPQ
ncbi:MAG: guanylate kinase [Bdellovibrionota bacterium]